MQGLSKVMPAVMLADGNAAQFIGLLPMVNAMKRKVCFGRNGFAGILARLADAVAAMIVRDWVERGCDGASGLVMPCATVDYRCRCLPCTETLGVTGPSKRWLRNLTSHGLSLQTGARPPLEPRPCDT
ncbi:hypothetical protein [Stenotrophomonas sp. CFBP 13725]|uniref:hypothetical protein n=1 Tax=Stenotrophomonas sp. CFBP 13725 TaxID=2775297 RepID=UPI0018D91D1E|nr:hypothetical protein [Stenotrophomonas sp. CFBP 13725]